MSKTQIASMKEEDIKAVKEIQKKLFRSNLQENISVQQRRFKLFPEGCWVIKIEDKVIGYFISHPWRLSCPPMLGTYIDKLPEFPDCLYLHDIGVLTHIAGKWIGYEIIMKAKQFAKEKGYSTISGVAVMKTLRYWKRYGFKETPITPEKDQILIEHYGPEARYLTLTI